MSANGRVYAVTGATGFIGQRVCRHLHSAGVAVRALVRSPQRADKLHAAGIELMQGDLSDSSALDRLVRDAAGVVHCAGAVRGACRRDFDRVNVDGTRNLLDAMRRSGSAQRLLALSSLAAREPDLSHYAASKREMERVIADSGSSDWLVLRPPAVYGPGDRELLPVFKLMAHGLALVPGRPDARFSMVFVDDLAEAVSAWAASTRPQSGVFTLDDGRAGGYDWHDVADAVGRLCNRRVRLVQVPALMLDIVARSNRALAKTFGYAPMLTPEKLRELRHDDWVCDSAALTDAIGWRPQVPLAEGLRRTPGWPGFRPDNPAF